MKQIISDPVSSIHRAADCSENKPLLQVIILCLLCLLLLSDAPHPRVRKLSQASALLRLFSSIAFWPLDWS